MSLPPIPPKAGANPIAAAAVPKQSDTRWDAFLAEHPLPWIVGPYGALWVAAGLERFDEVKHTGHTPVEGENGEMWVATVSFNPSAPPPVMVLAKAPEDRSHPDAAHFVVWMTENIGK